MSAGRCDGVCVCADKHADSSLQRNIRRLTCEIIERKSQYSKIAHYLISIDSSQLRGAQMTKRTLTHRTTKIPEVRSSESRYYSVYRHDNLNEFPYVLFVYRLLQQVCYDTYLTYSYFMTVSMFQHTWDQIFSMFYHTWDQILVCSAIRGIISSFLKQFRYQFQNSDLFCE